MGHAPLCRLNPSLKRSPTVMTTSVCHVRLRMRQVHLCRQQQEQQEEEEAEMSCACFLMVLAPLAQW